MSRPHAAALLEDAVNGQIEWLLRARGWRNRVISHIGYGSTDFVRVFARVVLGRAPDEGPPSRQDATGALAPARWDRGWRVFVTAPAPGVPVTVTIGDRTVYGRTDRSGYIDLVAHDHGLEPGWQQVVVRAEGTEPVPADVFIVADDVEFGLVSDIDDTVITTMLPRPMIAAWNTFVLRGKTRRAVSGMAPLYRTLLAAHPGAPIVYVSTGAWNTAPTLTRFLLEGGFPLGPLLLTDWGPTNTGWFRSGREHKRAALRRLRRELPHLGWVLVGDDGQHDPDLYAEFAREAPQHVRAIAIRELSAGQQVLSHGLPVPGPDGQPQPRPAVPVVRGPDGTALARRLRHIGVPGWEG
jgi:phosphatidate phosphatase APP1